MSKYKTCRMPMHGDCRKVKISGQFDEVIRCPWCNGAVSPQNIFKWCNDCYCLFILIEDKRGNEIAHFGKGLPKSESVILAQAFSKSGGVKIGSIPPVSQDTAPE